MRGTTRTPGADPTRLPIGLDLRAISIAEGVRAGAAAALPIAASVALHQPDLALAALGALLTCIADPAGPLRRRLPLLAAFVVAGAALLATMGLLRSLGIPATLLAAAPLLLATAYVRIYGAPAAAIGNLLAVLLLLGTDDALAPRQAVQVAAIFGAGGAYALVLTLLLWRIHPYGPVRRAVADVWDALAAQAGFLRSLITTPTFDDTAWTAHARAARGAVRNAIERARVILMETLDTRGPASGPAARNLMRLEAADQLFAALVALADHLEHNPASRPAAAHLLRRLRPLLRVMATATEREEAAAGRVPRLDHAIATMQAETATTQALQPIARALAERLRAATRLIDPAQYLPGSASQNAPGIPWLRRLTAPARANLTWRSAAFRHALRSATVTTAALAYTLLHHTPYTHWLTITLVLVMQPFFATTWQRTLERVGGTLLGGTVAAALSALTHSRLHLAGLLPILGALALAVRQVSYGLYIAVYTPVIILLVEQTHPAASQGAIALARAGYTTLGGLIAIAANALLWPAWQPPQLAADLAAAITAHAAYATAVLAPTPATQAHTRRAAGLASNNLEATLQRAFHEPRRAARDFLQTALVADAALRRIAGRLTAMALDPGPPANPTLRIWIPQALTALAQPAPMPPRPMEATIEPELERLARQVELLGLALQPAPAAVAAQD